MPGFWSWQRKNYIHSLWDFPAYRFPPVKYVSRISIPLKTKRHSKLLVQPSPNNLWSDQSESHFHQLLHLCAMESFHFFIRLTCWVSHLFRNKERLNFVNNKIWESYNHIQILGNHANVQDNAQRCNNVPLPPIRLMRRLLVIFWVVGIQVQ